MHNKDFYIGERILIRTKQTVTAQHDATNTITILPHGQLFKQKVLDIKICMSTDTSTDINSANLTHEKYSPHTKQFTYNPHNTIAHPGTEYNPTYPYYYSLTLDCLH